MTQKYDVINDFDDSVDGDDEESTVVRRDLPFKPESLNVDLTTPEMTQQNWVELRLWMNTVGEKWNENTIKALLYDWQVFHGWCEDAVIPWSNYYAYGEKRTDKEYNLGPDKQLGCLESFPATHNVIIQFIESQIGYRAPSSIRRIISTVGQFHQAAEVTDPTAHKRVKAAMKQVGNGLSKKQLQFKCPNENTEDHKQAIPMSFAHLSAIEKHPEWQVGPIEPTRGLSVRKAREVNKQQKQSIVNARNIALLFTGYDTLLRSAELLRVTRQDIKFQSDGSATLRVGKTKTNRNSTWAYLHKDTVRYLKRWIQIADIDTGPIFLSLTHSGSIRKDKVTGEPSVLTERHALTIYQKASVDIGVGERKEEDVLDNDGNPVFYKSGKQKKKIKHTDTFSTHSSRVGCALDMYYQDVPIAKIMKAGRWKSELMVMRYLDQHLVKHGGVASLSELQDRD